MNVMGSVKKFSLSGMFIGAMVVASSLSFTGCLTDDDKDEDPPAGTTTPLSAETTIDVAAQGATGGSVIDIDAGKALTSVEANAAQADIDLVFMHYDGAFHLDNAVAARTAARAQNPQINLANSYDVNIIKNIKVVKVTAKPANQEAAETAFDAASNIQGSVVTEGTMLLVETTEGKLALVTVGTIVGADKTAGAKIKLSVNSI